MSVKISELPLLDSLADNDVLAGVDTSANATKKIELATLKDYIDTNTTYTAGTNIDITNNVVSAPNVYNKDEMDSQIEELQSEVDSLNTIYNAFPTASGEGESVSLDGTAETKFKKIDLKGNTSQTGTPTPSSPIPVNVVSGDNSVIICGKNLLNVNTLDNAGGSSLTADISNNEIKLTQSGSGTYQYRRFMTDLDINKYKGKTISFSYKADNTNSRAYLGLYKSDKTLLGDLQATSYTIPSNTTASYIGLQIYQSYSTGVSGTVTFSELQLEVGLSETTYEPYTGATYPINLNGNMLDKSKLILGWIRGSNGNYENTYTTTYNCTDYLEVQPNTSYTIDLVDYTGLESGGIVEYNSSKTYIKSTAETQRIITFTTDSNTKYIRFTTRIASNKGVIFALGDTLPTPIELCKIGDYQDYFLHDKTLDKWYLHKEVGKLVLNGSENWSLNSTTTSAGKRFETNINDAKNYSNNSSTELAVMSNYFKPISASQINAETYCIALISSKRFLVNIYEGITTTIELGTWLSTHNTTAYYLLNEPTTTEITYQPLIEQLNNIEKAMSKDGQTNISQLNNDAPFIISAEAILSLQNVLDRIELLES